MTSVENIYEVARAFAHDYGVMEHDLKRAGFLRQDKPDAQANWRKFAEGLGKKFYEHVREHRIAQTLLHDPPRKLMREGLRWLPDKPAPLQNSRDLFEKGVCRVRNSYIHGEKFTGGPDREQWERDCMLVVESFAVLNEARAWWKEQR